MTLPVNVSSGSTGTLVATSGGDTGPFSAYANNITLTSSGSVTYEVRTQGSGSIDTFTIPITVASTGTPTVGTALVSATYAPTTGESSSFIPSFADTSVLAPLFSVGNCPTQLAFAPQPSSGTTGKTLPAVTVALNDQYVGLTASTAAVTVTSNPTGVSATVNAVNGVATFSNLVFNSIGTYTLTASSSGLPSVTSNPFGIGLPTTLTLTSSASPVTLGQSVTLTATLSPLAATGFVTLYDGANVLGAGVLGGGKVNDNYQSAGIRRSLVESLLCRKPDIRDRHLDGHCTDRQCASAKGFLGAAGYFMSASATSVAVGDFNGDGKSDLAVTDGGNVYILLGNGDGTFQVARLYYTLGSYVVSVATGDFNGDGKTDLAVANYSDNNVAILLGNGNGTFRNPITYPVYANPDSVAVADFNGDGRADLIVANYSSNTVALLLGNGDGTFQPATYGISGNLSVAVADFNGDGKADFGVINGSAGLASIMLGNGDGTFSQTGYGAAVIYPGAVSLATGDFNNDGKTDIAIATSTGSVVVFLGNGDGTLQAGSIYSAGNNPVSLAVADMDGDGKLDLVIANFSGTNISVLLGNGDGSFQLPLNYPAGVNPYFVAVGDFNGDGRADVAVANFSGSVSILLGANPTQLRISQPSNWIVGVPLPSLAVQVLDPSGNLDTGSSAIINITSLPAGVSSTAVAVNGIATFSTLTFLSTGTYTLTASSQGLASASTSPFTITTSGFTISGQVTLNGSGLGGVVMGLAGGLITSTITDNFGNYSFGILPAGLNYSVVPLKTGYSFTPPSPASLHSTMLGSANFNATSVLQPPAPVLVTPATNSLGISPTVMLTWNVSAAQLPTTCTSEHPPRRRWLPIPSGPITVQEP